MYPAGETSGLDLPSKVGALFINSGLWILRINAPGNALHKVLLCLPSPFWKKKFECLRMASWQVVLKLAGEVTALTKSEYEYLILKWTRSQYVCVHYREL